jgi:hypothetical protein
VLHLDSQLGNEDERHEAARKFFDEGEYWRRIQARWLCTDPSERAEHRSPGLRYTWPFRPE